jgi:hypothetical protein
MNRVPACHMAEQLEFAACFASAIRESEVPYDKVTIDFLSSSLRVVAKSGSRRQDSARLGECQLPVRAVGPDGTAT